MGWGARHGADRRRGVPHGGGFAPVGESARILGGMADTRDEERSDLLSRLEVIEAQPLATRADAYEALHDTLARRLEAGPAGTGASAAR